METTAGLQLIYDQNCPFYSWYSGLFVRTGFLPPSGRVAYSAAAADASCTFDRELARNQIALVDPGNGVTHYGIDSLLVVLGNRLPLIRKAGMVRPVHFLLGQLYNFISYNRKVIAPSDCNDACACVPNRSPVYRIVFIALCAVLVNCATDAYFHTQLGHFFAGMRNIDLVFFGLQLVFQGVFFYLLKQRNFYDYAGHVSFVSALGALLLLGFHAGLNLLAYSGMNIELLQPLCFGVVLTFMFYEHTRRLKLLHLSPLLSLTWIFFRISIYPFAFNL